MDAFLEAQQVYTLQADVFDVQFHGLSSYDGTKLYIVESSTDSLTVPHELEDNIRRFVEAPGSTAQAALVSPQKDPSLQINGRQCESGCVSEHRNGQKVPRELISPFSGKEGTTRHPSGIDRKDAC